MKRPTSVTVFGILNFLFAGLVLFGLLATIVVVKLPPDSNNPVIKAMHENQAYAAWVKISMLLGLLSIAALLASGIGLLLLKSWGRALAMAWSFYAIIMGLVGTIVNFMIVARPMLEQAKAQQGPEAAHAAGTAIGSTLGGCIGLIYPILLLIFMFRPNIVAAFRGSAEPPV